MIKQCKDVEVKDFYDCHEGKGLTKAALVLNSQDSDCGLTLLHDDLIVPGASIGEHPHYNEEEIYYIISGKGTFIYDGKEVPAVAGDVMQCGPGHSHGIINNGNEDLRLIVFGIKKEC